MREPGSLWRRRDFLLLWGGQAISEVGSLVTVFAVPYLALTVLDASPFQIGLLTAAGFLPFVLFSLPAGVVVDRSRKRPLMLWSALARAAIVGSIPLAAALAQPTLLQLYVVVLCSGAFSVLFDIAYQSYTPVLLEAGELVEGNGKLATTQSLASVAGPGLAGWLVALVGAANAILIDAISFAVSALAIEGIRTREDKPARAQGPRIPVRAAVAEGLAVVFRDAVLRKILACTASSNLFGAIYLAVEMVFFVRELHLSAVTIGLAVGLGGLGGLVGGLTAGRISRWVGAARLIWLSVVALGWAGLLVPLAGSGSGVVLVFVGLAGFSLSSVLYNVAQISYRQTVCPPELLGRLNASYRWVVWGTLPIGGLAGGALAATLGPRAALLVAGAGGWASGLWVLCSPLRKMRDTPEPA